MDSKRTVKKWGLAAGSLIILLLAVQPVSHAVFAVRLALSLQKLAAGATEQITEVRRAKVRRRMGNQDLDALLYYPAKSPAVSAIVLVAGLSEQGCYHPRLIALSRLLAERGMLVLTPDVREFRDFKISPEAINQILFWHTQIPTVEGGGKIRNIGLAGISFSGTMAMIAAAQPEIRDKVAFIVSIGPYSNLIRCTRGWFAAGPITVTGDYYPTRYYARWIAMLAAVDMIESDTDRRFLESLLHNLLLQKDAPPAPADLTAAGSRWYAVATMREDQSDPGLSNSIEAHLVSHVYTKLDPEAAVRNLHCPVFLIHGAYDDLIPPEESLELHQTLARSYLLISPFLTHTHPTDRTLSLGQKAKAAVDTLLFSYSLSREIR